jgi:hypothetical protein
MNDSDFPSLKNKLSKPSSSSTLTEGVKYDAGKPRMDLLPPRALIEVAKVLAFGAQKYAPDNWRKIADIRPRYTAAALRHIAEDMIEPGHLDAESGIDVLAHAICDLMFILDDRLEKSLTSAA